MKTIKSLGYLMEDGGVILEDMEWTGEWQEMYDEGEEVTFERGMSELKDYVLSGGGDSENEEEKWVELEEKLMKLKKEVGEKGRWVLWGVEYDCSLAVEY